MSDKVPGTDGCFVPSLVGYHWLLRREIGRCKRKNLADVRVSREPQISRIVELAR